MGAAHEWTGPATRAGRQNEHGTRAPWRRVAMAVAWLLLAGCAGALPRPGDPDVAWAQHRWPDTDRNTLERGRLLYVRKCSGCHSLFPPARFSPAYWAEWLDDMADEAELDETERDLVARYVLTMSRLHEPSPPSATAHTP